MNLYIHYLMYLKSEVLFIIIIGESNCNFDPPDLIISWIWSSYFKI